MEQKPVSGYDALAHPSPDIARDYLKEADAVAHRRDRAVDRRMLAWLQIANAVIIPAFLLAYAVVLRRGDDATPQLLLFTFLILVQLTSGIAQRSGMQWRMTRSNWAVQVGAIVLLLPLIIVLGFVVLNSSVPVEAMWIPAALFAVGFGGYGVVQLAGARRTERQPSPARAALPRHLRWGTALVGVALGVLILLSAAPDGMVKMVLVMLVVFMLLAWILAGRSELGLPAIGASWRWPHFTAFAISASALIFVVLVEPGVRASVPIASVASGLGVILLFIAVSFVRGRDQRA